MGTHSPWINRLLEEMGHEVLVANPSRIRGKRGRRKNDQIDAEWLARQGRADPALLYPVRHRSERAQADLALLGARDARQVPLSADRRRAWVRQSHGGLIETAHRPHVDLFFIRFDEGEDVSFRAEVNSIAFSSSSCSTFSRLYAFFTRQLLQFPPHPCAYLHPFVSINPSRACFLHRDNMNGWIENEFATSCTATPGVSLNRTADALKSSLYFFVVRGPGFAISDLLP